MKIVKHKIKDLIIQFDSSTALFKSLALYFRDKDFDGVGVADDIPPWVGDMVNRLPKKVRQHIYSWSGWMDAIYPDDVIKIDPMDLAKWVTKFYPHKNYSGVMFGSSNGAVIHLAAALGMPWLPQTYLIAMRRLMKPDEIKEDIEWGTKVIRPFLNKYPQIHAAQMHDPVQDRLMISKMGYFRIKMLALEKPFEQFTKRYIGPTKPLVSIECSYPWPNYSVGQRHTFQLGGFGSIDPYEYLNGSPRIKEFLRRVKAPVDHWDTHKTIHELPEAEWGFYEAALKDLKKTAKAMRAPFYRMIFNHPEGATEFVCDLYQMWYEKCTGKKSKRMLIENFGIISPRRTILSRSLPFWLAFNTDSSAKRIEKYLKSAPCFDELYLMLMSNGVAEGIGLTTIDRWKKILKQAAKKGKFIGVNQREYPLDFGTFLKYHLDLKRFLPTETAALKPLTFKEVLNFLKTSKKKYEIKFVEEKP